MKLYMHPVSMTSRPVRLMIAEHNLPVEQQVVDLFTGEHMGEPYAAINPNKLVPTLEDGDFRLTESSAILKFLADKFEIEAVYPKDLQKRARINERMDWFNTQFYREFGYGLTYPQIFPHHKRPSDDLQNGTMAWAKERANGWFKVLDEHLIGKNEYVCGNDLSIADYFGSSLVTLGEITRCDFSRYSNVNRWLGNMKKLNTWSSVNEALYGLADQVKEQPFEAI